MTYVHMDSSTITGMKYKGKRYTVGKPTDLSNYYTKSQTDSAINTAIIIAKSDIDQKLNSNKEDIKEWVKGLDYDLYVGETYDWKGVEVNSPNLDFNDHEISKIKFVIKDYTRFVSNFNWNTFMFDYYYDLYGTENGRERNELDMLNNFDLMVNQSSITVNNGNNRFQNCVKTDLNSDEDTYTVTLDLTEYVDDRSQYITEKVLLRQITFNQLFERWRGNFDVYEYTKTYATINAREFVLGAMNNSGGGSTGGTDSSVDLSNYFTKDELSELYYTKEEADERFQLKGETGGNTGTDTSVDLSDYFTKDEIEDLAYDMNILIQEKVDEVKDIVEVETKVNFFNDYDARGAQCQRIKLDIAAILKQNPWVFNDWSYTNLDVRLNSYNNDFNFQGYFTKGQGTNLNGGVYPVLKLRDQSQQEILDECVDVSVYNPDGDENFVNIDFWFKKDGDYIYNFTGNLYNPMTGLTCFNVNKEEQVIVEGKPEIIETESAQHIIKETYKNTYRKEEVDELIKNIDYSDFATKADVSANYQKKGNYVQDVSINDIIDDTMYRVKTLDYDLYYGPREWKRLKNGTQKVFGNYDYYTGKNCYPYRKLMIDIPDIDAFLKEVGYYFSGTEKYTYLDVSYTFNRYYNYDNRENRLEKVKRGAELRINFTKRTVENGNINNELDIQVINEGNRFCIIISPINAGRGSSYETEIINDGYITDFYFSGYFTSTPSISDDNRTDHIMNICAEMPTEINKVDANDFVNKVMSQPEVNLDNFYTKEEVDRLIENIDIPEMPEIPEVDLSDYYDKTEVDTLLSEKANKDDIPEIPEIPENISYFNNDKGYITIDDVSNKLEKKDLSDYYDKTEVDNLLNEKANKDDIKEVDLSGYAKIKYMTQDEYDSLIEKDQFTIYLITEDE